MKREYLFVAISLLFVLFSACDENCCLICFSVHTTDFFANLFGGNVPEPGEVCLADLQTAGGRQINPACI